METRKACPVCRHPDPGHHTFEHQVASDVIAVDAGAPACGCDPAEHDQTGPCIRVAGHLGDCVGLYLRLCPVCRHPWDLHVRGARDLTVPGAARNPNAPIPWACGGEDCPCGAWAPYDQPPTIPTGTHVIARCHEDGTAPHPPAPASA